MLSKLFGKIRNAFDFVFGTDNSELSDDISLTDLEIKYMKEALGINIHGFVCRNKTITGRHGDPVWDGLCEKGLAEKHQPVGPAMPHYHLTRAGLRRMEVDKEPYKDCKLPLK